MEKIKIPVERAHEPDEEARQPEVDNPGPVFNNKIRSNVTFAPSIVGGLPQNNSAYKDLLSQPPKDLSHKQKMLWLQQRRTEGLWAQCDDCDTWRYLPHVLDSHELPTKWYCWMNPDSTLATCTAPEVPICLHDEEDLIHAEYAAGSVVLARMPGFPWWPAMVDDCPDTEQYYWLDGFSDIPTHYNVVFFDAFDVTRAWIDPQHLMPYKDSKKLLTKSLKVGKYRKRLNSAIAQANDAEKLALTARLAKYSFISRYNGSILSPKKFKKQEIQKYQNKLKRKFNIDFVAEFSDSSEEDKEAKTQTGKRKNKAVKVNKKSDAKINGESHESPAVLANATVEKCSYNTTKDLNSLTAELGSDSFLIQHNLSEAIEKESCKDHNNNIINGNVETQVTEVTQKSDDFDF